MSVPKFQVMKGYGIVAEIEIGYIVLSSEIQTFSGVGKQMVGSKVRI